jgi:hypothetical protein
MNEPRQRNDDAEKRRPGTNPKYAEAKERALRREGQPEDDQTAYESGDPEMDNDDRPMDTGTPGGMLGTATHEELTRSPEAESSKADERLETDER